MAGDLADGVLDLQHRIDAENAAGAGMYTLPFRYAVSVINT